MALNVGADFRKRWLNAPQAVRQTYIDDLTRVCHLLKTETRLDDWQTHNKQAQLQSYATIEQTYQDLKAQLIEDARIRKQQALEQSLETKRLKQQQYAQDLQVDELQQWAEQNDALKQLQQQVVAESEQYSERYSKNPTAVRITSAVAVKVPAENHAALPAELHEALENLKIRLELEAESLIEQIDHAVKAFNQKLQQSAEEEIAYLMKKNQKSED
ncbi:MAG: hypothetical protein QM666_00550 [Acinetobacter sp.]